MTTFKKVCTIIGVAECVGLLVFAVKVNHAVDKKLDKKVYDKYGCRNVKEYLKKVDNGEIKIRK